MEQSEELRGTHGEPLELRLDAVEAELLWRGADTILRGASSLHRHLMMTVDLLQDWKQPEHVILAGALCGAVGYDDALFQESERDIIEAMVGGDAAYLIMMFSQIAPNDLSKSERLLPDASSAVVSMRALGNLGVIQLANLVQRSETADSFCWSISRASRLAALSQESAEVPVPVFTDGRVISDEVSAKLLRAYELLLRSDADTYKENSGRLHDAMRDVVWLAEPYIMLGLYALAFGDSEMVAELGDRAVRIIEMWNTSWDKRLSAMQWLAIAGFLRDTGALQQQETLFLSRQVRRLLRQSIPPDGTFAQMGARGMLGEPQIKPYEQESATAADLDEEDWSEFHIVPERFARYISGLAHNQDSPLMREYGGLTARPWWDPYGLELAMTLEVEARTISEAYSVLDRAAFRRSPRRISGVGDCDILVVIAQGKLTQYADKCSRTGTLLTRWSSGKQQAVNATFVRLAPGARTAPQRSIANTTLTYCLGIRANAGSQLIVDGMAELVKVDRCLAYDASFNHAFVNDGDTECAMLVVEAWHPDLQEQEVALLQGLQRMIAAHAGSVLAHGESATISLP